MAKPQRTRTPTGTAATAVRAQSSASARSFNLGERVRGIRQGHELTLEEAAKRTGLARSTLSKIENNQMSPTFEVLQKLAGGFAIDLDELLTVPRQAPPSGRRSITRADDGRLFRTPTYDHEFLCTDLIHKGIVPSRSRIHARSISDFPDWVRHAGDDFLLVLEGTVELHSEFYEPVVLERGDSIYYDAQMGHLCVSVSAEDALVLWVSVRSHTTGSVSA
jgi:transcriptional regulator with XRE-family HTH domain